jgi:hypothetical protein
MSNDSPERLFRHRQPSVDLAGNLVPTTGNQTRRCRRIVASEARQPVAYVQQWNDHADPATPSLIRQSSSIEAKPRCAPRPREPPRKHLADVRQGEGF